MNLKRMLLLALVVVLCYSIITFWGDVRALQALIAEFSWGTFAAALGLAALNYGLRFLKWQFYLARLQIHGVPLRESLVIFLSGFAMSITPAKAGEVFKSALLLSARGVPIARSAPIVVADRLTDLISLILIVGLGGLRFAGGLLPAALALLLVAGLMALVLVRPLGEWTIGVAERLPLGRRLGPKLREAYAALRLLAAPAALLLPTALSLIAWACEGVGLWIIIKGLGQDATLAVCQFIYATATVAGAVAMLPGGVGGTELTMITLLSALSGATVSNVAARAATLLVRLATLWFAVAIGAIALLLFRRWYDRHQGAPG